MTVEKDNFRPVSRLPNDPENGHLSKAQFVAKMRKQKELDAKVRAYEAKAREEVYGETKAEEPKAEAPKVEVPKVKKEKK